MSEIQNGAFPHDKELRHLKAVPNRHRRAFLEPAGICVTSLGGKLVNISNFGEILYCRRNGNFQEVWQIQ